MDAPTHEPEALSLAAGFPAASREQWEALMAAVLRKSGRLGEDDATVPSSLLDVVTYDGIAVHALYTAPEAGSTPAWDAAPGVAPFVRGAQPVTEVGAELPGWDIRQRHSHPDPTTTHDAVMVDLENGVTSLWLTVGEGALPVEALPAVLSDVLLDLAPVVIDAGALTPQAATAHLDLLAARGADPRVVGGSLGADPFGLHARTGSAVDSAYLAPLAQRVAGEFARLRTVTVDAGVFHDAGGSDAQELGASLAAGVAYLRLLTDGGLDIEQALGQLEFRYAASADQFLTIAKFRAARRLWARVAQACGVSGAAGGQQQHAVTSSAMMTRRDPWVNMLRTTLACFGAGVGGAQAVTVQPFDAALGLPDDLARRVARNTSSLLMLESHVARVIDPAGGSWYVESLTDDLATAAWEWFQTIERGGGFVAALGSGLIADGLSATWEARARNLAHRRDALTGVSEFPNLAERPLSRPASPVTAASSGVSGLPVHRYAEGYEALRDRSDAVLAATGSRPQIFVATLGSAAASTARATFAANLFQAGGLETPTSGTESDAAAIAALFTASGARIACLASSDRVYAEQAAPVAAALKAAGAARVWLAGSPGSRAASDAEAGIDAYVFAGCEALSALEEAFALADTTSGKNGTDHEAGADR